jgi:hypothetical protein
MRKLIRGRTPAWAWIAALVLSACEAEGGAEGDPEPAAGGKADENDEPPSPVADVQPCPGQAGEDVERVTAIARSVIERSFPDLAQTPISVCLDPDEQYFRALPDFFGEPEHRYKIFVSELVLGDDGIDDFTLAAVLAHELGHIVSYVHYDTLSTIIGIGATEVVDSFGGFVTCYERYTDFTAVQRGYTEGLEVWFDWVTDPAREEHRSEDDTHWTPELRARKYLTPGQLESAHQSVTTQADDLPLNDPQWLEHFYATVPDRGCDAYESDWRRMGPRVSLSDIASG